MDVMYAMCSAVQYQISHIVNKTSHHVNKLVIVNAKKEIHNHLRDVWSVVHTYLPHIHLFSCKKTCFFPFSCQQETIYAKSRIWWGRGGKEGRGGKGYEGSAAREGKEEREEIENGDINKMTMYVDRENDDVSHIKRLIKIPYLWIWKVNQPKCNLYLTSSITIFTIFTITIYHIYHI